MKKILILLTILVFGISAYADIAEMNLPKQSALAILWMQDGAEYKALLHQGFNTAKKEIKNDNTKKVLIRMDEILIDNSPYAAWLLLNNKKDNRDDRARWYRSMDAEAVDGAVDFINYLDENSVDYTIVTARDKEYLNITVKNLKKAGFSKNAASKIVCEEDFIVGNLENTIVITNSVNDIDPKFENKSAETREDYTKAMKKEFGKKYILMPNLLYGDFETALAKNYSELSDEKKAETRENSLDSWKGTKEFDQDIFNF